MPISKRRMLARGLARSGALWGIERLWARRGLVIWNYHRIGSVVGNPFDDGVYSATPEELRRHLRYLKRNFRLLTMEELLGAAEGDFSILGRPCAMVTFDDGYRDNFDLALPVLQELEAPATFFVPTGFLESPKLSWWDRIAYVLKTTQEARISLDYPVSIALQTGESEKAIQELIIAYKSAAEVDDNRFFETLESAAKVEVDDVALARDLFMSWEQVQQLSQMGMSIQGHTHSHPILGRLPEARQRWEMTESKRILEERLGKKVEAIAYPVGSRGAFSDATKRLAKESGYRVGFSFYGGINLPGSVDSLDIRRCPVDATDEFDELRARATLLSSFGKSFC
jgi:peptidoglycan/xylan/chitin deacetylase (PgdA/CDA1 family)